MFSPLMQDNILLRDAVIAADWCRQTQFDGVFHLPAVLSMDEDEKTKMLEDLHSWEGEWEESSPAELLTFAFQKKKDYEKFLEEMHDQKNLKLFARFEDE